VDVGRVREAMVKLFISFATEEFVTPAHDEILTRIAGILTERHITGSFHLTGEFARYLRDNQRCEVLAALSQHEIGYHSNTHGAYPFLGSLCEDEPWNSAVEKLMRTEAKGIVDIEDIFGRRPAYYVTEFTKAPQLIYALRCLGIDTLGFSDLPERAGVPFSWYTGSLCYTGPMMGIESPPHADRFQNLTDKFDRLYEQQKAKGPNGVIKLFNHPYKFAYNNTIASWVSKNEIYKSYDIHTPWVVPQESLYPAEITASLFGEFEDFLDHVLDKGDTEFLSTSDIAQPYRSKPPRSIPWAMFCELLQQVDEKISWRQAGDVTVSPCEMFALMTYALKFHSTYHILPDSLPLRAPLGPVLESRALKQAVVVSIDALMGRIAEIDRELDFSQQSPCELGLADTSIPLASAYLAFAKMLQGSIPTSGDLTFHPAAPLPEVASDDCFAAQSWTKESYPAGFTGENICTHRRLQSWTYKPAS
jgi:peptidoglycan/xylan/chitin deacetylase (PgdA/CDA1 family)